MLEFICLCLVLLGVSILFVLKKPRNISDFFSNNKGAVKGILIAVLFLLLFGFGLEKALGSEIKWSPNVYIYGGLDYTKKTSPQCESKGYNDRLTSNLGLGWTILESGRNTVALQYLHHSCEFNADDKQYDALGITIRRVFEF